MCEISFWETVLISVGSITLIVAVISLTRKIVSWFIKASKTIKAVENKVMYIKGYDHEYIKQTLKWHEEKLSDCINEITEIKLKRRK